MNQSVGFLPHSPEAERACLGAVILKNLLIDEVFTQVKSDDFFDSRNKEIATAILSFREQNHNQPLDVITLSQHLKSENKIDKAGGIVYLTSLVKDIATTTNAIEYAKIIAEKSLLRTIIETGRKISNFALDDKENSEAILDRAQQLLFELSRDRYSNYEDFKTITEDTFRELENRKKMIGIQTKFTDLDEILIELKKGNLIVIGGRPGSGKTAFALSLVENIAINNTSNKIAIGIFSLEMSKTELCTRIFSTVSKIPTEIIHKNKLESFHWDGLITAANRMIKAKIYIDDTPGLSVIEMASKSRSMVKNHNVKLIILDYLQLMSGELPGQNREQFISSVSRNLKVLAKELEIPIIALVQLNRGSEHRPGRTPILADIRDSGAIEQDADIVCLVHRPGMQVNNEKEQDEDLKNKAEINLRNKAEIIIAKNRHGPAQKTITLFFHEYYPRFDNVLKRADE